MAGDYVALGEMLAVYAASRPEKRDEVRSSLLATAERRLRRAADAP